MKAIINIFSNIQCVANNHSGLEATYLAKTYNLYYIGKKNRNNKHEKNYLDINAVDINNFTHIFLCLSQPNFFGGIIADDTITKIRKLCKYKGSLGILCNDPRIKPINAAIAINNRINMFDENEVSEYENLLLNATYLFPGKDLRKFYNDDKYKNFKYFNYFKNIFKSKLNNPTYVDSLKTHDVVYYGDKRGSYREKQLKKYMPLSNNNLLIGYKTKLNIPFIKKLKHNDLLNKLNECKVSLVLADKEHENNVITFRFYETLASNCLAAIPIEFDPNKELIKNSTLKDILYVKDKYDVKKISNLYSKELIELQHNEYRRIMSI